MIHVMAHEGEIELFEPPHALLTIPTKNEEGMTSFRRQAEELMMDESKWTDCTPWLSKRGHQHYKNVNDSGGVAYLSVGTLDVSAKLATQLQWMSVTNAEVMMNGAPKSFQMKSKNLKEIDENTVITESQLISPGGACHSAWLVMRDPTGDGGVVLQYSIVKGPDGVELKPLKTIDDKYKQAYGMMGYKFAPIKGRETEPVCEFRFLHQWFENAGPTESEEDSKIIDSKPVPGMVAELIFRKQIKTLLGLAGHG